MEFLWPNRWWIFRRAFYIAYMIGVHVLLLHFERHNGGEISEVGRVDSFW